MIATKLKLAAAALLALGVVAGGTVVFALQAVPEKPEATRADVAAARDGERPGADAPPDVPLRAVGNPPQPLPAALDLLMSQLDAKRAELKREEARLELANAVVASNESLNRRRPGMVSKGEMLKGEGEGKVQAAQVEIVRAEIRGLELRIARLIHAQTHPDAFKGPLDDSGLAALERRVAAIERTLDRMLKAADDSRQGPQGLPK